jgi:hypothetical protein
MAMLRDLGSLDRFAHLHALGLDPADAGRLDVSQGTADHTGFFVEATTGDARLLQAGDPIPDGVWVARRDVDGLQQGPGTRDEPHGFGEGWGTQGAQLGGDRSYPEEDAGGTRRVPHGDLEGSSADPVDGA